MYSKSVCADKKCMCVTAILLLMFGSLIMSSVQGTFSSFPLKNSCTTHENPFRNRQRKIKRALMDNL
ncbi:unnamed protein product [Caenorhabditis nigoni]